MYNPLTWRWDPRIKWAWAPPLIRCTKSIILSKYPHPTPSTHPLTKLTEPGRAGKGPREGRSIGLFWFDFQVLHRAIQCLGRWRWDEGGGEGSSLLLLHLILINRFNKLLDLQIPPTHPIHEGSDFRDSYLKLTPYPPQVTHAPNQLGELGRARLRVRRGNGAFLILLKFVQIERIIYLVMQGFQFFNWTACKE